MSWSMDDLMKFMHLVYLTMLDTILCVVLQVQNLTRIHHKNLVELIGYCIDREGLALVYEYMAQGSLMII
ncbi:hypothetical protein ZIOFF_036012 [Zingiber officinale]|uniref:Serine-threonine/tyrosine-protein kinase catalytic domain-containing protein n=1 Tax=Zingiber officinale TaxID=94328 RepID=A0A8J5G9W7_ZINOF|nr:hypothetical protein ZIOFF_036012 [Zingiber officinale]